MSLLLCVVFFVRSLLLYICSFTGLFCFTYRSLLLCVVFFVRSLLLYICSFTGLFYLRFGIHSHAFEQAAAVYLYMSLLLCISFFDRSLLLYIGLFYRSLLL